MATHNNFRRRMLSTLLMGSLFSSVLSTVSAQTKRIEAKPLHYDIPSWFKSSFLDIPADWADAKSQSKRLMIFFHLENCPFCAHLLRDNFTSGSNKAWIQSQFEVIAINVKGDLPVVWMDGSQLTEKDLTKKLNIYASPVVMVFGADKSVAKKIMGYKRPEEFMAELKAQS